MADAEAPEAPIAIFKKRGAKGKSNLRKRPATPPPAASDSDDSDYSSSEDESGQRVKRRKKNAVVTASSRDAGSSAAGKDLSATVYTADRSVPITSVNDATKQSNWYDEGKDELSAKNLLGSARSKTTSTLGQPDGTYKGLANQTSFIQKNPDAPQRSVGPMKAPTNIRTITITDYAPDVCKDYKQTGFCGVSLPETTPSYYPAQFTNKSDLSSATTANTSTSERSSPPAGSSTASGRSRQKAKRTSAAPSSPARTGTRLPATQTTSRPRRRRCSRGSPSCASSVSRRIASPS